MNGFTRRRAFSFVSAASARCPPPARNHRRRTPGVDNVVKTLVAQAYLHRMSQRDNEMAASERSVHAARGIAS